jgi:hypothetical protein
MLQSLSFLHQSRLVQEFSLDYLYFSLDFLSDANVLVFDSDRFVAILVFCCVFFVLGIWKSGISRRRQWFTKSRIAIRRDSCGS